MVLSSLYLGATIAAFRDRVNRLLITILPSIQSERGGALKKENGRNSYRYSGMISSSALFLRALR